MLLCVYNFVFGYSGHCSSVCVLVVEVCSVPSLVGCYVFVFSCGIQVIVLAGVYWQ